ncbi:MAG: fibronectin type III domain-containing protein [bacterium]|nr:MAG: fibronectin type III domain-containing protein [bacterium]
MKNLLTYFLKKSKAWHLPVPSLFLSVIFLNNTIIVQWLPNSELDLAGYNVYYGKASRSYSNSIPAGLSTECTISNLQPGYEYFFAVTAYDTAGNESQYSEEVSIYITGDDDSSKNIDNMNVYNVPNPFNPEKQSTKIRYYLQKSEDVTITIYDVGGNKIRTVIKNELKSAGEHFEDTWDGKDESGNFFTTGIYYAQVNSESLNHYITIAITK